MPNLSDPGYVSDQYRNASTLLDRVDLHERFSTNRYGWHRWAFDQLHLPPASRILEVGCGPGLLWMKNLDRIPEGWELVLSDLSPGMVQAARGNLRSDRRYTVLVADVQNLSLRNESFDAVIANHMLYHVPGRSRAYSEIRRVLKPGGRFYAATNGRTEPACGGELRQWLEQAIPSLGRGSEGFSLETGGDELTPWFSEVQVCRYVDSLAITEAAPLIAYVRSGKRIPEDRLREFEEIVENEIARNGVIEIPKAPGMFLARKLLRTPERQGRTICP